MSKALTELIRDANRYITPADRHAILDLIEQQATLILSLESRAAQQARTIAAMCQQVADLNAVAPAVDAQPVAEIVRSELKHPFGDHQLVAAVVREALEQASALCQAIANGYVSDVNPKRSREAADAAIFCAREIAALSQHTGEKDD